MGGWMPDAQARRSQEAVRGNARVTYSTPLLLDSTMEFDRFDAL